MVPTYETTDELGGGFLVGTHGKVKREVDQVVAGRYGKGIYVGSVLMLIHPILSPQPAPKPPHSPFPGL